MLKLSGYSDQPNDGQVAVQPLLAQISEKYNVAKLKQFKELGEVDLREFLAWIDDEVNGWFPLMLQWYVECYVLS
jgi:hypothetical protein